MSSFKNKRILELPAFQAPAWNSVYSLESRIEVTSSTHSSAIRLVRERFTPSGMLMFTITALESSVGAISLLMLLKQKYAPNKSTATIGNNSKRHLRNPPSKREYIPFSQSKNGSVSLKKRPFFWCFKNLEQSIGESVKAQSVERNTVPIITATNSRNKSPVVPPRASTGMNTAIKTTDVAITAKKISFVPAIAACFGVMPLSILW